MKLHDDVHNYYEKLMLAEIEQQKLADVYDNDTMADFCCTVLNHLPPRYIRFEVDMAFYLPQSERETMIAQVKNAINIARSLIAKRESNDSND